MAEQFTARCRWSPGWKSLSACLGAKLGKQGPHPQGNLSSPGLPSLEITSRRQLYFSSRPRKAAKPGGRCQKQLQWLKTPCPLTDQSVETRTLIGHTWKTDKYSAKPLLGFGYGCSWAQQPPWPPTTLWSLTHCWRSPLSFWTLGFTWVLLNIGPLFCFPLRFGVLGIWSFPAVLFSS